jgi:DNA-binding IclR family transcriptional regulator
MGRLFYDVNLDPTILAVESTKRSGTQTLGRAMLLLRELAARGQFGWGLGDLAARCGLDKGTAHRLLAHLKRERMVQQRASDRRYLPGPLLFELSLALPEYAAFCQASTATLDRLAKRLGGVAFLCLRSNLDFVCAARAGSTAAMRGVSIEVGTRRPLLTSAAGVAMLVAMPRNEAQAIVAQNSDLLARHGGLPVASFMRMLRQSEGHGLGVNEQNVVPGWNAYAMAMLDLRGEPFASIMVAAEAHRLSRAHKPQLDEMLRAEAGQLAREAAHALLPVV